MQNQENLINKEDNQNLDKNRYGTGLQGQDFVEAICIKRGYCLHRKNLKKIGLEIDLILYRYIPNMNLLIVRIIEVKTRHIESFRYIDDLESFGLVKKWIKVKGCMYDIVSCIRESLGLQSIKHTIHFDLVLVSYVTSREGDSKVFKIYKYIEDADLLI